LLDRIAVHLSDISDPAEAVIEGIAYMVERLPKERFIGTLLARGSGDALIKGVTSARSTPLAHAMLERMNVDWRAHGYDDADLDGLAQFSLRMLQSLILDPPPKTTRTQLRAFLRRWVAPAVRATTATAER